MAILHSFAQAGQVNIDPLACFERSSNMLFTNPGEAMKFLDIPFMAKYAINIRGYTPTPEDEALAEKRLWKLLDTSSRGGIVPNSTREIEFEEKKRVFLVWGKLDIRTGDKVIEFNFKVLFRKDECLARQISIGAIYSLRNMLRTVYRLIEEEHKREMRG